MKFLSIFGCVRLGNIPENLDSRFVLKPVATAVVMLVSRPFEMETNRQDWKHLFRFEDRNIRQPNLILGRKQQKPALANFI